MDWFEFKGDDDTVPKWKRTIGYDPKTDEVFLQAILLGPENVILLNISYDGEPYVLYKEHMFVSSTYIIKETDNPEVEAFARKAEQKIRAAVKKK